jgi:hypothetical protein
VVAGGATAKRLALTGRKLQFHYNFRQLEHFF